MLTRILWRLTTPRALRRRTLMVLLAWFVVANAYQNGHLGEVGGPATSLPVAVPVAGR